MDQNQIKLILLIAIGGAVGSILRYVIAGAVTKGDFPLGTFTVNFIGSFLLAFLFFMSAGKGFLSPELRALLFVGLFGGFTTLSTFSLETVSLLVESRFSLAAINVILNGVLCVGGAFIGRMIGAVLGAV